MTASDRHGGLADVLDDHLAAEFAARDVDATMATMTDDPYLKSFGDGVIMLAQRAEEVAFGA